MHKITPYFQFFLIFYAGIFFSYAQTTPYNSIKYEELEKKIDSLHNYPDKIWQYINIYIQKSKVEKNEEALIYAYRYASNLSKYPLNIKFADSALIVGKNSGNKKLLTDAYLNRGFVYMNESQYKKSLDDILTSNKYAKELKDDYIINKNIYLIAQNKIYLGLYDDANKELKECLKYFKDNSSKSSLGKNHEMYYIYSLMSLIDSNTKIGKQKENKILLKEAFSYIEKNNLKQYLPYFISCEGVDNYYNKNYINSIEKLSKAIRLYNDQWPHITEIYYLALSNWKLNKHNVAIKYLEEIDKEYNKTNKLDPQFRSAYEILIKFNDSIGNKDKQLEYINKLMLLDKSYEKNYKYLYTKINKEYDTQKLMEEKNKIENSLKRQRLIISIFLLLAVSSLLFFINRYIKIQKFYKEKFKEIISEKTNSEEEIINSEDKNIIPEFNSQKGSFDLAFYDKIPGLNPLIVENILQQLNIFEMEHKYIDSQVSIKLLSENLGTNATYLSKIINAYKNKNFNQYINDLRLEYIIEFLKENVKYLNMDVKDLAKISGFVSTDSFSNHFQRRYEMKPSMFIKMMKENVKANL